MYWKWLQNARDSLGDVTYKSLTVEFFDPGQFLASVDLSSEHKILDLKNKMEASVVIWKRKMHQKESRSSWGASAKMERRELFEERAETILILIKQRFPGLPQSSLDICKIESNRVWTRKNHISPSPLVQWLKICHLTTVEHISLWLFDCWQQPHHKFTFFFFF